MTNEKNPTKQKLNIWIERSLVAQIDGVAAKNGISRAAVVAKALKAYLDDAPQTQPAATHADIELLRRDLETSFAAVAEAIKQQPIAVQPAPEPKELPDPDSWKKKSLIDRIFKH